MDAEFKLKEELKATYYTTERLLNGYASGLRKQLVKTNCEILDIGCGQSLDILDLIKKDYKFTAVDADEVPLNLLRKRITDIDPSYVDKVNFIVGEFPKVDLNYEKYDAILFHNILHFFTLDELKAIFKPINARIKSGTLLSIAVHSHKHPSNQETNERRYNFFKHYFKFNDLRKIFPPRLFSMVLECDFVAAKPAEDIEFLKLWCYEVYTKIHNYTDKGLIEQLTNQYLNKKEEFSYHLLYTVRKK